MKKISVIIPVHNTEQYLEQCIDSVLNQTYSHIEVIIINDNSKDNSINIINKYQKLDNRIILVNAKQTGLSNARNTGLQRVTGDFVIFLDSDDYYVSLNAFSIMVNAMIKHELDILMFDYTRNLDYTPSKIQNSIKTLSQKVSKGTEINNIFFQLEFYAWNNMFRSSFIKEYNKKFTLNRYYEDIPWISFYRFRANKIFALNEVFVHYRVNNNSITIQAKRPTDIIYSYWDLYNENKEYFYNNENMQYIFFSYCYQIVLQYFLITIVKRSNVFTLYTNLKLLKIFLQLHFSKTRFTLKNTLTKQRYKNTIFLLKYPLFVAYIYFGIKKSMYKIERILKKIYRLKQIK